VISSCARERNFVEDSIDGPVGPDDNKEEQMKHWALVALTMVLAAPLASAQMDKSTNPKSSMPSCEAMMKEHAGMQKHMAEMDAKLQSLVDEMNRAEGAAKIDRMAAVITELVAQRTMMRKQMAEMQPQMMHHMMEHMQGGKEPMAACPMMNQRSEATPHQHH
jgi:hypothetical protein